MQSTPSKTSGSMASGERMTPGAPGGVARSLLVGAAFLAASACGGASGPPRAGDDAEGLALSRIALDVLAREACPRLLVQTFSLEDPRSRVATGKLWVRRCEVHPSSNGLDVDVDILGWQWADEASWGFAVAEYVYFDAHVRARLDAEITTEAARAKLRVWSAERSRVEVREIGRVSARAQSPASSILGVASRFVGHGPNDLATSSLRGRVGDLIRDRLQSGLSIVLGDAPTPGAPGASSASASATTTATLLDETQRLFPGGALLSGSYPADTEVDLRFSVSEGEALARPVCVDTAVEMVDATMADRPRAITGKPSDVVTLRTSGTVRVASRPCPWVLVTGPTGDVPTTVSLSLVRAPVAVRHTKRHWVRATILGFELSTVAPDQKLIGISIGTEKALFALGRPLTSARSPSLRLVAHPIELDDDESLILRIASLQPRPNKSWWAGEPGYDDTEIGRAAVVPSKEEAHTERDIPLDHAGKATGFVRLALDVLEVE